jgi:hypothetical protein
MPWHVGKKTLKGWPIVRSDTGEVVGYSKSKWKAEASVRIRYQRLTATCRQKIQNTKETHP